MRKKKDILEAVMIALFIASVITAMYVIALLLADYQAIMESGL